MASSSDPEKDSNTSEPRSENPFIKFKQFADQQISSLLHGIIGLPSALSGKPVENSKWAVFDEDLRRRDELQARQQEFRESEARRLGRRAAFEEGGIATQKPTDWKALSHRYETSPTANQNDDGVRDLQLYSPVTKSLFAHLDQPVTGSIEWQEMDRISDHMAALTPLSMLEKLQHSSDTLKTTQSLIFDNLNRSHMLRSDYSLLPYLMFSPYSPLRLSENRPTASQSRSQDVFPYCEAFEDLIRTTQPPPKHTPFSMITRKPLYLQSMFSYQRDSDPIIKAMTYHAWIEQLHHSGLLQESEIKFFPRFRSLRSPGSVKMDTKSSLPDKNSSWDEVQTEQDMYDRFLRWAAEPHKLTERMDSIVAEAETMYEKVKSGDFSGISRALDDFLGSKPIIDQLDVQKQCRTQSATGGNKSVEDPDKIVAEYTETRRVQHVNGSVTTYVEAWKKFADGRETTTTSSHAEEQERDENGNITPLVSTSEEARAFSEKKKAEKEADIKKEQKKGWFWN